MSTGETTKELTDKQAAFVQEYLVDLNATQAAIRAGYSKVTAYSIGSENLKKPEIMAAIEAARAEAIARVHLSQDWVLMNLKTVTERCMQTAPVLDRKGQQVLVEDAEGDLVPAYTFNAPGATGALALIGKHLGMFVEKQEISGPNGGPIPVGDDLATAKRVAFLLQKAAHKKD